MTFVLFLPPQTTRERFGGWIRSVTGMLRGRAPSGVMPEWMMVALTARLIGIGQVVSNLLLAMQAGTLRTRRSPAPGGTRRRNGSAAAAGAMRLPSGYLWLVKRMGWHAAVFRGQLETVLADPEMTALLAASPRAVRTLKPLCRMLGAALPVPVPPIPPASPTPKASSDDGPVREARRRRPRPRAWTPSYNPPIAGEVAHRDEGNGGRSKNRGCPTGDFSRPFCYDDVT